MALPYELTSFLPTLLAQEPQQKLEEAEVENGRYPQPVEILIRAWRAALLDPHPIQTPALLLMNLFADLQICT